MVKKRRLDILRDMRWLLGSVMVFGFAGLDFTLESLVPSLPLEDRTLISLAIIAFTIIAIAFASQKYER